MRHCRVRRKLLAKDGIQLIAVSRVTVRTNLDRLVGGAGEQTIIARVGEGMVSTIGSANTHMLMTILGPCGHLTTTPEVTDETHLGRPEERSLARRLCLRFADRRESLDRRDAVAPTPRP